MVNLDCLNAKVDALIRLHTVEGEEARTQILDEIRNLLSADSSPRREEKQDVDKIIHHLLLEVGMPVHIKGYRFSAAALALAVKDPDIIDSMIKGLYPAVAEMFGTTGSRVERAIRHAIEVAWDRGNLDTLQRFFGYTVSNTKGSPTNSEFIARVAQIARDRM